MTWSEAVRDSFKEEIEPTLCLTGGGRDKPSCERASNCDGTWVGARGHGASHKGKILVVVRDSYKADGDK